MLAAIRSLPVDVREALATGDRAAEEALFAAYAAERARLRVPNIDARRKRKGGGRDRA